MPSSVVTPSMVGRARELEALRAAHHATLGGTPGGAVVAGEAGIGKTRLLEALVDSLDPSVVVARGQCLDMGSLATPFAPLRGFLRDLVAHFGADQVLTTAGPAGWLLPALLPELTNGPRPEISQDQLHDLVAVLLENLSVLAPLVIVVEDVHWADAPTLNLLRSLLHTMRRGRVSVLVSYRSDDVDRDHPLRPFLHELGRARHVTTVELARLTPEETAEQIRQIRGAALDAVASLVVTRSDGVPFFVEELVALEDAPGAPLPQTLREIVLARYAGLTRPTQDVVRVLAAGGVRVDHDLAEQVHGGGPAAFESAVQEAMAARVLTTDGTAYTFRHALVQEAVHDELMPGQRRRVHARYAEALQGGAGRAGLTSEIAHHWLAARDHPRALEQLVAASREASASGAPLGAAQLGERALELWPLVPDAEERAGCARSQLFLDVAVGYDSAGDVRALEVLDNALDHVGPEDARGRALLLHEAMVVRYGYDREGGVELCRQALELLPDGDPDEWSRFVRARVECGLGIALSFLNDPEGPTLLRTAAGKVRALMEETSVPELAHRARMELVRAVTNLATVEGSRREVDVTLSSLAEARAMAGDDPIGLLRVDERVVALLYDAGRYPEARAAARSAWELARSTGMEHSWGQEMAFMQAHACLAVGDLPAAGAALDQVRQDRARSLDWTFVRAARVALLRAGGELEAAGALFGEISSHVEEIRRGDPGDDITLAHVVGALALAQNDPAGAWKAIEAVWAHPDPSPGLSYPLLVLGATVLADLRRKGREPPGTSSAEGERRLRETFDALSVWDVAPDWRALLEAELSGPDGTGTDPGAWEAAVAAAARGRVPLERRAYALYRLGAARLDAGDRPGAADALTEAASLTAASGLGGVGKKVDDLAHRARLRLGGQEPDPGDQHAQVGPDPEELPRRAALTAREQQVLELVAQGLTNRQIGERLFISDKTASVHVSAILRKLGTTSRAGAAAQASRLLG